MQEINMEEFVLDLSDAEELPTVESPWYIAVGGKAVLIVAVAR